ncbi:glutaredoxin [Marinimicrobium sp. ABcell2]|uniref:glutaredoxin n=1 Tax=Marinimicrobium sp. ABcell2 TaxID=3069751 RepID=UPI0027B7AAF9|nr:glutaredoxin [Marinimicrobium sp. ABcell2]MDQ2075763.1 glutaredoxin [Marinimicrobium sp. ABcell2]
MAHSDNRQHAKTAELYRMVTDEHICPFGLKSKDLLERQGFEIEDHHLKTREQADAFKHEHQVDTTPQAFIDGERIGGYEDLRKYFGLDVPGEKEVSYQPIIAIFSTAFLMALAVGWVALETLWSIRTLEWFVAISMCLLGLQKLKDLESFSTMFLNYDLLAQKQVRYSYVYPFAETLAGILMLAGVLIWLAAPMALFIGTIGAASVFKAVYIDKRELKCACAGGDSKVPLGFVSLTENLIMILMGLWMPIRMYLL